MPQHGWEDCPEAVRGQIERFIGDVREILGETLDGAYLHGSLAMGCFNPARSDVDLLFVTREGMSVETKRRVAELLLWSSGAPRPLEVSFLRRRDLEPWQFPTPFDFHYGEDGQGSLSEELAGGGWREWNQKTLRDPDLAAHVTITRHRGRCLYGRSIEEVFPNVPREDYLASIVSDFRWARDRLVQAPVYFVLNSCRVLWYLREGAIGSKDEAGVWASESLPERLLPVVRQALEEYRGVRGDEWLALGELSEFADYMEREIGFDLPGARRGGPDGAASIDRGSAT